MTFCWTIVIESHCVHISCWESLIPVLAKQSSNPRFLSAWTYVIPICLNRVAFCSHIWLFVSVSQFRTRPSSVSKSATWLRLPLSEISRRLRSMMSMSSQSSTRRWSIASHALSTLVSFALVQLRHVVSEHHHHDSVLVRVSQIPVSQCVAWRSQLVVSNLSFQSHHQRPSLLKCLDKTPGFEFIVLLFCLPCLARMLICLYHLHFWLLSHVCFDIWWSVCLNSVCFYFTKAIRMSLCYESSCTIPNLVRTVWHSSQTKRITNEFIHTDYQHVHLYILDKDRLTMKHCAVRLSDWIIWSAMHWALLAIFCDR